MNSPDDREPQDATSADGWTADGHVEDELLAGFALQDRAVGGEQHRAHVAQCARCGREVELLREAVVIAATGSEVELVAPPSRVWDAVEAATGPVPARAQVPPPVSLRPVSVGSGVDGSASEGSASDGAGVDRAGARPTAAPTPSTRPADPQGRGGAGRARLVPFRLAAAAAAVALVLGAGVGALVSQLDEGDQTSNPTAQTLGTAELTSVDAEAEPRGTAELRRQDDHAVLHVQASDLDAAGAPDGAGTGTREVWLLNEDGRRMVSLGLLAPGESGDFTLPERLLAEGYRVVDISYEPDDGDPVHSGQSLARGTIGG